MLSRAPWFAGNLADTRRATGRSPARLIGRHDAVPRSLSVEILRTAARATGRSPLPNTRRGSMTKKVSPIPEGYHTVTPYLIIKGAAAALEFYKKAFGATELVRMAQPD